MIERPTTGGKKPRSIFRNQAGFPQYAVVNFLMDGEKTSEQEIVPMAWIVNGKQPKCSWPKDKSITRRQLDKLVFSCAKPTKEDYTEYAVRILHSGCTYEEAKRKFEVLAVRSNTENDDNLGNQTESEREDSEDDEDEPPAKKSKPKKSRKKGSNSQKKKSLDHEKSFDFSEHSDDDQDIAQYLISSNGKGSKSSTPKNSTKQSTVDTNFVSRQLFSGQPQVSKTGDTITMSVDAFKAFETKLFQKLNILQNSIAEIIQQTKTSSSRQLITFPASVSDSCTIPAVDVTDLETLDKTLSDKAVRTELATYLSQLGGKNVSDFLSRALPKLISDEVCYVTNWSGSAIPAGSLDATGNVITREHKKTFGNLEDLLEMFCESTRLACPGATDKQVETYIQKWLLSFKDRITPRKHQSNSQRSPRKKNKKSPKKMRHQ